MNASDEFLYNQNSILIVVALFFLILLANEIGIRVGKHYQKKSDNDVKTQTNTIQAGILGLLALILGFTFNMALQRYNTRNQAVINEANAIGTALLRTKLLPSPYDSITFNLIQDYIDLRLQISVIDLTKVSERHQLDVKTNKVQNEIWQNTVTATDKSLHPVTTGYFLTALNDAIDAKGEHNAALQLHVPQVILLLLFAVFITVGALMGYSSGLGHERVHIPTILMAFMISLLVFIIIDLDRPKRGIIKVSQESMLELKFK
jgi:hypothetical protein